MTDMNAPSHFWLTFWAPTCAYEKISQIMVLGGLQFGELQKKKCNSDDLMHVQSLTAALSHIQSNSQSINIIHLWQTTADEMHSLLYGVYIVIY